MGNSKLFLQTNTYCNCACDARCWVNLKILTISCKGSPDPEEEGINIYMPGTVLNSFPYVVSLNPHTRLWCFYYHSRYENSSWKRLDNLPKSLSWLVEELGPKP